MEVRHINRSSSATRHPKVYTGAKSEYELTTRGQAAAARFISFTSVLHQLATRSTSLRRRDCGPSVALEIPGSVSDLRRSAGSVPAWARTANAAFFRRTPA